MSPAGLPAPPAGTTLDWLWYLIAGVLAITGLWTFYWALLRDRSRGRRRCPKCWYSMEGVPGTVCPECGKETGRERRLLKTRRRWWAAVGACILLLGAYIAARTPEWRRIGWVKAIPTTALMALGPTVPSGVRGQTVHPFIEDCEDEIYERLITGRFWQWQSSWYIRRCLAAVGQDPGTLARVPPVWIRADPLPVDPVLSIWLGHAQAAGPDGVWHTGRFVLPASNKQPAIPVRILTGERVLYEAVARPRVRLIDSAAEILIEAPVSSRELVAAMIVPELVVSDGALHVRINEEHPPRREGEEPFIIAFRVAVCCGAEEVATSGPYSCSSQSGPVGRPQLELQWKEGAQPCAEMKLVVISDAGAAETYRTLHTGSIFSPVPARWAGRIEHAVLGIGEGQ